MNGIKFLKYSVVIVAVALCASSAKAMTVAWAGFSSNELTLADMVTPVADAQPIELGVFNGLNTTQVSALSGEAAIEAAFTVYATGLIGDGTSTDGSTFTESSGDPGTGFFSKQAYLYVKDTVNGQWGVFASPLWIFPVDDLSSAAFDLEQLSPAGLLISNGWGTLTFYGAYLGDTANAMSLIPEPSTYALIVMGLFGAMTMIRRRRS